ncbi:MAG: presenilin family intramembrane aspartyl protease [Patescibacteria group bacterium]|nr:presenilin family intramembrane aspartyl protease [Patescibacteria group bacterium]
MKNKRDLKLNFLVQTVVAFLLTAVLAMLVVNSMMTGEVVYTSEPVKSVYIPPQPPPEVEPGPDSSGLKPFYIPAKIDIFQFLLSFFIATSLMLLFLKKFKGKFLFEFFFSGAIIFGAQGPFGLFLSKLYAFLAAVLLVVFRFTHPRIWTQNIIIIIGISGIAASLGASINPVFALFILILLSVYDVIAIYKTRHMVKLFKGMASRGAVLALIIPKSFSLWKNKFDIIKADNRKEFIFIGTGDIALPLFFATAAFVDGVRFSIAIIIGAIIGLIADHLVFVTQKEKKAIPALPMIAFFSIAGYIIVSLI